LIISIDAKKAFDKIQQSFMIKAQTKLGIERMYLNIIKTIYDKPTVNIIFNRENLKPFAYYQEQEHDGTIPTPIQHSTVIPSLSNKARRRNKRNTNR
jgi:hypothetical protein